MTSIWLYCLNTTIAASLLIAAVLVIRCFYRSIPSASRCVLFLLVGIRLVLPVALPSPFGFLKSVPDQTTFLPAFRTVFPTIWLIGTLLFLTYLVISTARVYSRVRFAVPEFPVIDNRRVKIYRCDEIETAFVLGIFRPKIYVPTEAQGESLTLIVRHEQAHIRRHDPALKLFFFLMLAVHWFNPLVWLAYFLLSRDIEEAADASVIEGFSTPEKETYASALLTVSDKNLRLLSLPVAFGEVPLKSRVSRVFSFRRPKDIHRLTTALLSAALIVLFFTGSALPEEERYAEESLDVISSEHYTLTPDEEWWSYHVLDENGTDLGMFPVGDPLILDEADGTRNLYAYWDEYTAYLRIPVGVELLADLTTSVGGEKYLRTRPASDYEITYNEAVDLSYFRKKDEPDYFAKTIFLSDGDAEKFNALTDRYLDSYPELFQGERGVAWIYADMEVRGRCERRETGFLIREWTFTQYIDVKNPEKSWRYETGSQITPGMDATGKDPVEFHVIVDVSEENRQEMFDVTKKEFLEGYGLGNGDTKRSEVYHAMQLSLPVDDRLSATWTLMQYERVYSTAFVEAVRNALPYWDYGDPFDESLVTPITRADVEARIVSDGVTFSLGDKNAK